MDQGDGDFRLIVRIINIWYLVWLHSDLWSGPQPAILVTCIPRGRFGYIMVPGMHYSRLWTPLHDGRVKKKHVLRSMIYMILHSFDRQQWTYTSTCNSLTPVYTWTWIMSWCVDGIWYIYHSSSVGKWFIPGTWCHTLNYKSTCLSWRENGVIRSTMKALVRQGGKTVSGLCVLNILLHRCCSRAAFSYYWCITCCWCCNAGLLVALPTCCCCCISSLTCFLR